MNDQPPPAARPDGWLATLLDSVKSLTLTNVLILALLVVVAIPAYFVWKALNDPAILDRFLSSYSETLDKESGCVIRKVRLRGGPWRWSIASGFALSGNDRYSVSVVLPVEPDADDIAAYCATITLIVEKMLFDDPGGVAP